MAEKMLQLKLPAAHSVRVPAGEAQGWVGQNALLLFWLLAAGLGCHWLVRRAGRRDMLNHVRFAGGR